VRLALAAAVLLVLPAPARASACRYSPDRPDIAVGVYAGRGVAALTFDDGPDPRFTPKVLAHLASAGVQATFFVTGRAADAHPEL
jgi:peptidoglycan/xylan/chitin deacetylase (PgdA/CDA1 family)